MSMYDLDLNTDVIHEDSTTYQSLLDKNQIDLFSDEHMKQKEMVEKQIKGKEKEVLQGLFVNQPKTEDGNEAYNGLVFQKPMVLDKKMEYQDNGISSKKIIGAGTILLILLFLAVMVWYFKRSAKKMEEVYE